MILQILQFTIEALHIWPIYPGFQALILLEITGRVYRLDL